jgi:hypothetical protein
MEHQRIAQIPTPANVEQAWQEYHALATEYVADDTRKIDFEFCKKMARAYQRWSDVFLRVGGA